MCVPLTEKVLFQYASCQLYNQNIGTSTLGPVTTTLLPPIPERSTVVIWGHNDEYLDVIDLQGKSCDGMSAMPHSPSDNWGYVKDSGRTPVACFEDSCFEYDGSSWNLDATSNYNREGAAWVQMDDDTFYVAGQK